MEPTGRRSFLKWATQGLIGLFTVLLGVPAVAYLIDPRNRPASTGAFKRVGRLTELEVDVPRSMVIRDVRRDAWTLHPSDVIGRVWLVRRSGATEDGRPTVEAFTTTCPHLGGSINFDGKQFVCPLHGATFDLACRRVGDDVLGRANPAPRDMDCLEIQLVPDPAKAGEFFIDVKFENFLQGHAEKVRKT